MLYVLFKQSFEHTFGLLYQHGVILHHILKIHKLIKFHDKDSQHVINVVYKLVKKELAFMITQRLFI